MAKIKWVVSATIEETFSDFIISKKTKGLAEKALQSCQSQFQAVARHMDVKMDIAMLQKADLDAMIISMRDASLSPNSINSYTRLLACIALLRLSSWKYGYAAPIKCDCPVDSHSRRLDGAKPMFYRVP